MIDMKFPGGATGFIAFLGLFHTAVASLAIGLAFLVTISQLVGFRHRMRRHDLFAKRTQLLHVAMYNVGTINAIGLVFALSGLFPQFWEQLFVHMFWPLIIEEFIFLLLATTLTFHYFFWDYMWGHKKVHIFMGAVLTPLFFLQFFLINAVGGFMLTPGFTEEASLTLSQGILGYDKSIFYNPSLLMLTLHRLFANVSYAGFFMAGWCGIRILTTKDDTKKEYFEDNGRLSFYVGFAAFLSLPIVGYFYSIILRDHADAAFWNLMLGAGDVVKGGVDLWWVKHMFVAAMVGGGLAFYTRKERKREIQRERFSMPRSLIYALATFYLVYYMAMGQIMTWAFFWWMLGIAVGTYLLFSHLLGYHKGSGKTVFVYMGILSLLTVMLGGWSREAARPRFTENRHSHYDVLYVEEYRQPNLMIPLGEEAQMQVSQPPLTQEERATAELIREVCSQCHGLGRLHNYPRTDWDNVVERMVSYGAELTDEEADRVVSYLEAGKEF